MSVRTWLLPSLPFGDDDRFDIGGYARQGGFRNAQHGGEYRARDGVDRGEDADVVVGFRRAGVEHDEDLERCVGAGVLEVVEEALWREYEVARMGFEGLSVVAAVGV